MNNSIIYPKALPDIIIFLLIVIISMIPQLQKNILGYLPPFLFLSLFLMLSWVIISNKNSSKFPPGFLYFFFFSTAIIISQINAIEGQFFLTALGSSIMWLSVPYIGIWLSRFENRTILFWTTLSCLFFYLLYVIKYYDHNILGTTGPLFITTNDIGYTICLSTSIILGFMGSMKKLYEKVTIISIIIILLSFIVLLIFVGSRSALIAQFFCLIIVLTFRFLNNIKLLLVGLMSIILLVTLLRVVFVSTDINPMLLRKYNKSYSISENASVAIRLSFALKAIELLKDFPVFGGGWNNFRFYTKNQFVSFQREIGDGERVIGLDYKNPHSNIVRLIGETGLYGTISYSALIVYILFRLWKIRLYDNRYFIYNMGYWLAVPAYLIFSLFHDCFNNYAHLIFALVYSVIYKHQQLRKI